VPIRVHTQVIPYNNDDGTMPPTGLYLSAKGNTLSFLTYLNKLATRLETGYH